MKQYSPMNIINMAVLGHGGAGKTSLCEAMLYLSGVSDRRGKIGDGNTICDNDPEEIKRQTSVSTAVAPMGWKNKKINLIDAPGLFDFEGGVCEAVRAADTALIILAGKSGVSVGTEKAMKIADKKGLSKILFVNGLCDEGSDFYGVFEELKSSFGPSICPLVVPYFEDGKADKYINMLEYKAYDYSGGGKPVQIPMPDMGSRLEGLRTAIYEAVAETDEELFEKYFSGEEFTPTEVIMGVHNGVKSGAITPVFCGDALLMRGMEQFMDGLCWLAPSAEEKAAELATDIDGNPVEISVNENAQAAAVVFKTVADPFIGKLSYVKVLSGKISSDSNLVNMRSGLAEKIGKTISICGKKQIDTDCISAGDIGVIPKLTNAKTGDTLCSPVRKIIAEPVDYPTPNLSMAIVPANKGDEEKIAQGILRLCDEDPTIEFYTNHETHQMILVGLGEQHLDVIVSKLKSKFGVEISLIKPKVAYRETIRKTVKVQGRHKKQTGGHGQFGDVWIEFSPCDSDGLDFSEKVVGGAVPKGFFPAVEKGLRDSIVKGTIAGYPVVGLKAVLCDGSYHPVDSSEMAFKMAASIAYRNGIPTANPVLLEPIGILKAIVPDDNMGDIMGEVNKRRGRVLGMSAQDENQVIEAEVPMAEMHDFSTYMRQISQGRGSFTFEFVRYEDLPSQLSQKIIDDSGMSEE
ncbi:MAG: elongation factor G [Clostridia bacterium]